MSDINVPIEPVPAAPRCAVHPELDAVAACASCANLMCAACAADGGQGLCLACRSRASAHGFPYSRAHFPLDGLFNISLSRFKANWALFCMASAAFLFLGYGLPFVGGLALRFVANTAQSSLALNLASGALNVVGSLLQMGCELIMLGICLDLLENKPLAFDSALLRLQQLPAAVGAALLAFGALACYAALLVAIAMFVDGRIELGGVGFWIVIGGALVAIPPAIYVGLGISFAGAELVHEPDATLISALRTSWRLVEGQRWSVLGIALVALVIVLAGVFACCVGLVATLPLGMLLHASLFLALKNQGSDGRDFASSPEHPV